MFALVNRDEFDLALVRVALGAGAEFAVRSPVTRLSEDCERTAEGVVQITTQDGSIVRARAVVGADGSAGCGKHVGVQCDKVDLGLEAEIAVPPEVAKAWAGRILLDWGPVAGSYGWVSRRETHSRSV